MTFELHSPKSRPRVVVGRPRPGHHIDLAQLSLRNGSGGIARGAPGTPAQIVNDRMCALTDLLSKMTIRRPPPTAPSEIARPGANACRAGIRAL
jgi:hypothetical protein